MCLLVNSFIKLIETYLINSNVMDHGGEKKKHSFVLYFRLWVLFSQT